MTVTVTPGLEYLLTGLLEYGPGDAYMAGWMLGTIWRRVTVWV